MERGSANNILFEEEEPSIRDHRDSRTVYGQKYAGSANSHQIQIIEQEIQYLTDKIKTLELQTDSLVHLKNQSALTSKNSINNIDLSTGHSAEILMTIEKKIQIIVKETRKIVDKLGDTFEKRLQSKLNQKINESGIEKMKQNYGKAVKTIEGTYKKEIEKINKQHKETEKRMMGRVTAIEQKLTNRMNEFEIKEKEYVDWIHHLEIQLQKKAESKKKIDITYISQQNGQDRYAKKEQADSSILTGGEQNYSTTNPNKIGSQMSDNSKVMRRHRIFDPVGGASKESSSVSPNRIVSPISAQPKYNPPSSKDIQPVQKPQEQKHHYEVENPGLVIDRMTEPLKNNFTIQKQTSPWRAMEKMDKSAQKTQGEITRRNQQIVKDVNADEFYKDVPKPSQGWQQFQNYQQVDESSSDSEQDVIFYGNQDKMSRPWQPQKEQRWKKDEVPMRKQQSQMSEKVFSPFDLN